jgi:hypothetical protein
MKEAIKSFFDCDFQHMKGFILEYGEADFFEDLAKYFASGRWNNPANKYAAYVGIVNAFFKMY